MDASMKMGHRAGWVLLACLALSGCESLNEKGPGLGGLDTIDEEDKAEEAWFKSFYGSNHCGVSQGACKPGEDNSSSGGGMWGGGIGPSGGGWNSGGAFDGTHSGSSDSGGGW